MQLAVEDAQLFFRLRRALLYFANQQLKVLPGQVDHGNDLAGSSFEELRKVREAMMGRPELLDLFLAENPAHLSSDHLDLVRSWRHGIAGKFWIYRQLNAYAVFLTSSEPIIAYGVLGFYKPIDELVMSHLPVAAETVLLPFKDKIITDGILNTVTVSLGPEIRWLLNKAFHEAKARQGVVVSLPLPAMPATELSSTVITVNRPPKPMTAQVVEIVIRMTDDFCRQHLNEEYAELCRLLAQNLARRRPSPLLSGNARTWAGAIVRTICWVNYVDDPTLEPCIALTKIDGAFGIDESQSSQIRKMLNIDRLEPEWTLTSMLDQSPRLWLVELNGTVVDVRKMDLAVQEAALREGLIPYLPRSSPQPALEGAISPRAEHDRNKIGAALVENETTALPAEAEDGS